jgi:hypothetical protein
MMISPGKTAEAVTTPNAHAGERTIPLNRGKAVVRRIGIGSQPISPPDEQAGSTLAVVRSI